MGGFERVYEPLESLGEFRRDWESCAVFEKVLTPYHGDPYQDSIMRVQEVPIGVHIWSPVGRIWERLRAFKRVWESLRTSWGV